MCKKLFSLEKIYYCLLFLFAFPAYAATNMVSTVTVHGNQGVAVWELPLTKDSDNTAKILTESILITNISGENFLPVTGLGIVNNCELKYFVAGDSVARRVVVSLTGVHISNSVRLPEAVLIDSYSLSCKAFFTNESTENIVLDNTGIFTVNFERPNYNRHIVDAKIVSGTLEARPTCTLSVPDSGILFTGSARSFKTGFSKNIQANVSCTGVTTATLFATGTGEYDGECLLIKNSAGEGGQLTLCMTGFALNGSAGKSVVINDSGNNEVPIEVKLFSKDEVSAAAGEYKAIVYLIVTPA